MADAKAPENPGLFILSCCSTIQNRIDHAKKHLAMAEGQLQTIQLGKGMERFDAVKAANQHLDIVIEDMNGAKLLLEF